MVDQPNPNAPVLPPPFTSAIPVGMCNKSSSSHTLVFNRETKGMIGSSDTTIFNSFWFHLHSSPLVTSTMSASICHPKAPSTKTDTSCPSPKVPLFAMPSKSSQSLPSPFYQLPFIYHGWQETAVLSTPIKGKSKASFTQAYGFHQQHNTMAAAHQF